MQPVKLATQRTVAQLCSPGWLAHDRSLLVRSLPPSVARATVDLRRSGSEVQPHGADVISSDLDATDPRLGIIVEAVRSPVEVADGSIRETVSGEVADP